MNKLTKFSKVLFAILSAVLLIIIVYPGHTTGMVYDIGGYRLRKMAERGDMSAQYRLGRHYASPLIAGAVFSKKIREADDKQAVIWYRKAAEQGCREAQNKLAECCMKGQGVRKDLKQAVLWFGKAAAQGSAADQRHLAKLYEKEFNDDRFIKLKQADWFHQGAEEGSEECQYQLALCYKHGQGVKKDYKEAARWFREGAESGSYDCQYQLGRCYAKGEGVGRDIGQAVFWYREAAEQGCEDAQKALKALKK